MIRRGGEIQERLVKTLRALADQIERLGVVEDAVSFTLEYGYEEINNGYAMEIVPTRKRRVEINFVYAEDPTYLETDGDSI